MAHIRDGRAYFLAAARSILLQRIRRERVVRIDAVTDVEAMATIDDSPSPEQVTGARRDLERVLGLIAGLPPMSRKVIELRKLHGFSQKETAQRLGVSEAVVENNSIRGLRAILRALEADPGPRPAVGCFGKDALLNDDVFVSVDNSREAAKELSRGRSSPRYEAATKIEAA